MEQKHYKIEIYCNILNKWRTFMLFWGMRKTFSQGAWEMLCCYYSENDSFRLVDSDGVVIDEWVRHRVRVS